MLLLIIIPLISVSSLFYQVDDNLSNIICPRLTKYIYNWDGSYDVKKMSNHDRNVLKETLSLLESESVEFHKNADTLYIVSVISTETPETPYALIYHIGNHNGMFEFSNGSSQLSEIDSDWMHDFDTIFIEGPEEFSEFYQKVSKTFEGYFYIYKLVIKNGNVTDDSYKVVCNEYRINALE